MYTLKPDFTAFAIASLGIGHQLITTLVHLHIQVVTTDVPGFIHGAIDQQTVTPWRQVDSDILNAYLHIVDTSQEYGKRRTCTEPPIANNVRDFIAAKPFPIVSAHRGATALQCNCKDYCAAKQRAT